MKYNYVKAKNFSELSDAEGLVSTALDFKTFAKDIPCQNACPANTNVPLYIEQVSKGNYNAAYRINLEDNVFPGVLGRVCTRPCESNCRHNWTNVHGAVQICHIKRISADFYNTPIEPLETWFPKTDKKIAVIGGGPAGLTVARELSRYGHSVTIYERDSKLGGMMINGIPRFRLPAETVDAEINTIIKSDIEVVLNTNIDYSKLKDLESEFDAVVIATGTSLAATIDLNINAENIFYGNDFMYAYNNNQLNKISGNVVIIGGGFTAVDCSRSCARVARKLIENNGEVSIIYRRNQENMAANYEEFEAMDEEKIHIKTLRTPIEVLSKNGKVTGVRFIKNKLSFSPDGGKPTMTAIEGSEYIEPCDYLIIAIGQVQDYSVTNGDKEIQNQRPNIFSTGDFKYGGKDIITAVADAKNTAENIDIYLTGKKRRETKINITTYSKTLDAPTGRTRDHDIQWVEKMPMSSLSSRALNPDSEVETGFDTEQHKAVSSRCYLCHYKFEINHEKCIHCNWCIEVTPRKCISRVSQVFFDEIGAPIDYIKASSSADGKYIFIDSNECVRCGKCLRACPTDAITMVKMTKVSCNSSH